MSTLAETGWQHHMNTTIGLKLRCRTWRSTCSSEQISASCVKGLRLSIHLPIQRACSTPSGVALDCPYNIARRKSPPTCTAMIPTANLHPQRRGLNQPIAAAVKAALSRRNKGPTPLPIGTNWS